MIEANKIATFPTEYSRDHQFFIEQPELIMTDAERDTWIAANVAIPDGWLVVSTCYASTPDRKPLIRVHCTPDKAKRAELNARLSDKVFGNGCVIKSHSELTPVFTLGE